MTTKTALRDMATDIQQSVGANGTNVFVGTWLDRSGLSLDIRFDSKTAGRRVVIHKWDDEDTCTVRYITGDFWRNPQKAQEFASATDVPFDVSAIVPVIREQVTTS